MKAFRLSLGILAVLAIGLFAIPATAHADTYQIFDLGPGYQPLSATNTFIYGITDSGYAILDYMSHGGGPCNLPFSQTPEHCYETWVHGHMAVPHTTVPPYTYDNGTPCTVSAPFLASSVQGTCNNGHEVYNAVVMFPYPYTHATFTGPDPVADFFADEYVPDNFVLNSSGDFVYAVGCPGACDERSEIYEAIDLTTDQVPEPSGILLLTTGLFAFAGTLRRRLLE